jgi:SAM-dependent methyltransferase
MDLPFPIFPSGSDHTAPAFYATPKGQMAAAALRAGLQRMWPDLTGQTILGLGYPAPFLSLWRDQAYACLNATTSHHEPPPPGACSAEATQLPFPDLVFDRVLVIHGVEPVGQDSRLLREIWRVLKDDGRILVVAPNRTGLWAHMDSTPFGQGRPYSRSQINNLLASAMFRPERRDTALFTPPTSWPAILRLTRMWEKLGHAIAPELAGVTLTEAVKDAYAALPVTAPVKRRVVFSEAA